MTAVTMSASPSRKSMASLTFKEISASNSGPPVPSQRVALPAGGRCGSANSCRSLADMRFLRLQKDVNISLRHRRQIRVLERTPNFEVTAQLFIDCNHCSISRFHLKSTYEDFFNDHNRVSHGLAYGKTNLYCNHSNCEDSFDRILAS